MFLLVLWSISVVAADGVLSFNIMQEFVEAAQPKFVVGEFWSTCVYDDKGQLVYDQVSQPHES